MGGGREGERATGVLVTVCTVEELEQWSSIRSGTVL